jgi:hypothetical protein
MVVGRNFITNSMSGGHETGLKLAFFCGSLTTLDFLISCHCIRLAWDHGLVFKSHTLPWILSKSTELSVRLFPFSSALVHETKSSAVQAPGLGADKQELVQVLLTCHRGRRRS